MKKDLLTLLSRHQFLLTSIIIGIFITSGAFFSTKYSNQIAAVTAGTCYPQSEVSTKEAEKLNLLSQASSTAAEIQITEDAIVSNWSALTTANAQITKLTPTIISDYAIQAEKTKVDTLYTQLSTQLSASKAIDSTYAQMMAANASATTAKTTYTTLYTQLRSANTLTMSMKAKADAAKISKVPATRATYPTLLNQYSIQLAKYNALNAQYKATLTQYNTYTSQFTTLSSQYTTLVTQYRSKYTIAYSKTTTATLQAQYDTLNASYQKLISDNNAIKDQIATLNTQITNYKTEDTTLNKKVADLTSTLATLRTKIAQADNAASIYRGNVCPRTETDPGLASIPSNIRACADNIDNDRNGKQDCDDLDCKGTVACQVMAREMPTPTNRVICNDEIDNDRDGAIDCNDEDCQEARRLGGDDEFCTGESVGGGGTGGVSGCTGAGADNFNPLATVDDGSCTYSNKGTTEICGNGVDDNNNGFADCADPSCSTTAGCTVVDCSNPANCSLTACANSSVCDGGGGGYDDYINCDPGEAERLKKEYVALDDALGKIIEIDSKYYVVLTPPDAVGLEEKEPPFEYVPSAPPADCDSLRKGINELRKVLIELANAG